MKANLWKAILFWINVKLKYEQIKEDPEESKENVSLGVRSLIYSIVGAILTVGLAYLTYICFTSAEGAGLSGILMLVGGIFCALAALLIFTTMLLASLVYAIYQVKLNKKPLGIVALVLSILLIIGTVAGILIVLSLVSKA